MSENWKENITTIYIKKEKKDKIYKKFKSLSFFINLLIDEFFERQEYRKKYDNK